MVRRYRPQTFDVTSPKDSKAPQRAHERFDVNFRIRLKCPDWAYALRVVAVNAGRGGIFVGTQKPPPPGTALDLVLELPTGKVLTLSGTARHVVTPERALAEGRSPGVGIEIDPKHADDLKRVEAAAKAASGGKASAAPVAAKAGPAARGNAAPTSHLPAPAPPPVAGPKVVAPRPPRARPARPQGQAARAVGIDFGTSYSSISAAIGDRVYLIPDSAGRVSQPSVVGYLENGSPVVGWQARELQVRNPRRAVSSAKRLLGRKFSDPAVASQLMSAAYKTTKGPNDSILVEMEGKSFTIGQVCATVISHVHALAEDYLGIPVSQAVLSVPVSFTDAERAALRKAAEIAELEVLDMIAEPVAGALAYGIGQQKNEIVAVYDFGGGTFDFSVLDFVGDQFRVLGTKGDAWLGGDDFDVMLAQDEADNFWRETQVEIRQRVVEWQRLLLASEKAKRDLSTSTTAELSVPGIVDTPKRIDLRRIIDRSTFERLCADLLERSLSVCQEGLQLIGLEPSDMTQVLVVGGVSHIPFVRDGVSKFFGREIQALVNPDEAVALGAGLLAARRVGHGVRGIAPRP